MEWLLLGSLFSLFLFPLLSSLRFLFFFFFLLSFKFSFFLFFFFFFYIFFSHQSYHLLGSLLVLSNLSLI
jgi:hypothetical protein